MIRLAFINVPEGHESEPVMVAGIQITYNTLRVSYNGDWDDEVEIANLSSMDELWHYAGKQYTDVSILPEKS